MYAEFAGKVQLRRYGQLMQSFYEKLLNADKTFEHSNVENYPVFLNVSFLKSKTKLILNCNYFNF